MLRTTLSYTLTSPWADMEPVRLGRIPAGLETADRFVAVESDEKPLLRIDLYVSSDETFAFEDVQAWSTFLVVGWGEHLYLVDPSTRHFLAIHLGSYFGHMYPAESHLLIASAQRLFLISLDGVVLWQSEALGIDGVVVNEVNGGVVHGEGEWDPPGGWRPFSVSLHDGRPA
jgi:hypothetical protein